MARVLGLIFALGLFFVVTPASASTLTYEEADAACHAYAAKYLSGRVYSCDHVVSTPTPSEFFVELYFDGGRYLTHFGFHAGVCEDGQRGGVWLGEEFPAPGPMYSNLGACRCIFSLLATYADGRSYGRCVTNGEHKWDLLDDGTEPTSIAHAPPDDCGGAGSCYKPESNEFCVMSEGEQYCVPGPAQGQDGGPNAGKTPKNCGTFNGKYLCAGSPDAPLPNIDPEPPLLDTKHLVTYDAEDGSGSGWITTVNVYDSTHLGNNKNPGDGSTDTGSVGNKGNNGSEGKADSDGLCSDGKTPSAGGCGAGYADRGCDLPPTCSGDPLLCAGIKEQHATRCAQANARDQLTDMAAVDAALRANGIGGTSGPPSEGDWYGEVELGGGGSGGVLDSSGWGYARSCPLRQKSFTLMGQSVTIDYSKACGALNIGGILIMIAAYLAAARILMIG